MAKQHHERCRFSSKVLVTALLCLLEPLSAKYISGIVQTASCMKRLGSFTFGTASTLATNTIVTIDVPERYENVWLVGITSTTNMWGTTDLEDIMGGWTCYDIIKTIANLVVDAYPDNVQVPTVSEFLSYSADPEFLLQFPAVRLNKNSLTPDEIFAKEVFDVSSISSTCTGDTSIVSDGVCDDEVNNLGCGWDGGDCCEETCYCDTVRSESRCVGSCGSNGYSCRDAAAGAATDAPTDTCDCCTDIIAELTTGTSGFTSFYINTLVAPFVELNLYLLNVDLEAGDNSAEAYPNCQGPLMNITYQVTFLNAPVGSLFTHLSNDDVELLLFCFVLTPLYICLAILASLITRQLKKLEKYHWTAKLLMYSVYISLASQLLWLADVGLLATTGVGAVVENEEGGFVRVFQVAALLTHFLGDALMLAVGILLAKGWSVVRRKLTARSRIIYGSLIALYVLSCETAVVWNAATITAFDEHATIFYSDPGYLVVAIRLALYFGFIWAFVTTIRKFKAKRKFFNKLFAIFSVWILFQIFVGVFINSSGLSYGLISTSLFVSHLFFLLMFWPNQKFNAGFPFHIRTSQMTDAAERSMQSKLDDAVASSSKSGDDAKDGASTAEQIDAIRASTNPLTRSRVLLQKMQGEIDNFMLFSTELGRALEEMQTFDDDPESGEELEDVDEGPTESEFGSEHAQQMKERRAAARNARKDDNHGLEMADMSTQKRASRGRRRILDEDDSD